MTCAVIWRRGAVAQPQAARAGEADPAALADAADAVYFLLRAEPFAQGESRDGPARRVWFRQQLLVVSEISTAERKVYIGAIRWLGRE